VVVFAIVLSGEPCAQTGGTISGVVQAKAPPIQARRSPPATNVTHRHSTATVATKAVGRVAGDPRAYEVQVELQGFQTVRKGLT
jgi:hypothetical protein